MPDFSCKTCDELLECASDAQKHFSTTRHRSVKTLRSPDNMECDKCEDSNIHQLAILRFGRYMALLCQPCLDKNIKETGETPAAKYTLSNGALFDMLTQYSKSKRLECSSCGAKDNLFVKSDVGGYKDLCCGNCLKKGIDQSGYVSDKDDKFMATLFGSKDQTTNEKSRGRGNGKRGGRGGKRGGRKGRSEGRPGRAKKDDPEAESRRQHYQESKKFASDVKSGRTAMAIGSGTIGNNTQSGNNRTVTKGRDSVRTKRSGNLTSGKSKDHHRNVERTRAPSPLKKTNKLSPKQGDPIKETSPADGMQNGAKKEALQSKGKKDRTPKTPSRKNLPTPVPELELPPYITKYHPSPNLKLSYDSLDEYFREMSFNVFLEDQLTNVLYIIEPEDLLIEWYQDQDKKNNQFKVSIPMKPEVMDRFLSDTFKKLKKDPFQKDQAMFLILGDEIPWYGKVATVDSVKTGRNRKTSKVSHVEMVIVLYKWNNQPLPKTVHAQHLKLLPASIPVSRIFNAMDKFSNPSFIKMLLGKEPIKQISFNNRVNFSSRLNDSQKAAIQSVLNNKISVVQGPPGTGKTSAIYETITQLLESLNTYPILVVAASNIAIDNIAEKLLPKHANLILRIVATSKEREYNKDHPLAKICLHHKIYNAMSMKQQEVQNDIRRGTGVSATAYKKFMQEKFQITSQQVAQAKVILTTTVVAGGNQLKSIAKCPVVIMDEATQSSEPSTLIPLAVAGAEKFVFVGDQKQLSCFSLIPSLSTSLFERVLLNGTYKQPHMLDTQYRMHPAISEFPRRKFYEEKLIDGIDAEARKMDGIPEIPLYFWDTKGAAREQSVRNLLREDRGYTFTNREEVSYIQQVLKNLIIEKGIQRENIGVVTPYSGQRDLISSVLVKDDIINPTNEELQVEVDIDDITNDSKPVSIHIVSGIMIASIDAFQGREKDFMIMSCVRSNKQGTIGFLKDERRLNVALTRARYGLIMVGDVECLKKSDKLWKEYMEYLEEKKMIHRGDQFIY